MWYIDPMPFAIQTFSSHNHMWREIQFKLYFIEVKPHFMISENWNIINDYVYAGMIVIVDVVDTMCRCCVHVHTIRRSVECGRGAIRLHILALTTSTNPLNTHKKLTLCRACSSWFTFNPLLHSSFYFTRWRKFQLKIRTWFCSWFMFSMHWRIEWIQSVTVLRASGHTAHTFH